MLELLDYQPEMREQLLRLLGEKEHRRLIWDWQYCQSPFGRPFKPVIAAESGQIIGFNGVMPVDVMYDGAIVPAVWSCDFIVHPAHRGTGVGRRMKERLTDEARLILSLGISDLASPLLLKMGWRENRDVRVYTRIRKPGSLKGIAQQTAQWISRVAHPSHGQNEVRVELAGHLPSPDEIDMLWGRVGTSYGRAVCRTGRYLHWRYGMHPLARYQFLRLEEDGKLIGIAVLRESGTTLHLVDYLGVLDRPSALAELLLAMERLFPDSRRQLCLTSNRDLQAALLAGGFLKRRGRPRFYVRSRLDEDGDSEVGWFVMSGDSDGDLLDAARVSVRQGRLR
jgi:GNAT superfamily N-acetyltransferase